MRYLVTGKQMKEIDRYTIETIGIPSLVLMERAAYAFVEELKKRIRREDQIWAVCGNGNNGADGVAAARMLFLEGYQILVILARGGDRGSEEYLRQVSIARNLGMNLIDYDDFIPGHCDVLIDAVFGVGLSRPVEGVFYDIITSMSQIHPRLTAAVDIPSGVCADTGKVMRSALAVLTGLLILTLILLQGSFGLGGYEHEEYPAIRLMSGIRLTGDFLERVDLFWVAALVFGILFSLGSVFFYSHELLARIRLEKTALAAGGAVVLGALACEKAGIAPEFFIEITMEIYGPLLFLLLILAGLTGKKGKIIKTGFLTMALLGLSGCGVSLEDRVFPMSMGADYENGHYRIVYGIPQLSKVTGQDKEETQSGEEQALVYEGLTPQDALERFDENQENYLDMGHMKAIILGEHIMENRDALTGFLGFLENNPAVAGNIYVFVTEDMEELMRLDGQGVDSVGDYLTGILENTMDQKKEKAVILQDLYGAWHREEEFPKLPEVTIVNKKPSICQHSG